MKKLLYVIAITAGLAGCGGGGGVASHAMKSRGGGATIEKVLKPEVKELADTAATRIDVETISAQGMHVGQVFTWQDRAYVAVAVTGNTVKVRAAEFDEVLSDLKVTGDLSLADAEPARNTERIAATEGESGFCKTTETEVSCAPSKKFAFWTLEGKVGIRDVHFKDASLNARANSLTDAETTFTPFSSITAKLTPGDGKNTIAGEPELVRVPMPISATLGFLRIEVPIFASYKFPIFDAQIGMDIQFPLKDGARTVEGALLLPLQKVDTNLVIDFTSEDNFLGVKIGPELVFGPPGKRWAVTGAFAKVGESGSLSLKVDAQKRTTCFTYSLVPKAGFVTETSINDDPIQALSAAVMVSYDAWKKEGKTGDGCEEAKTEPLPTTAPPPSGVSFSVVLRDVADTTILPNTTNGLPRNCAAYKEKDYSYVLCNHVWQVGVVAIDTSCTGRACSVYLTSNDVFCDVVWADSTPGHQPIYTGHFGGIWNWNVPATKDGQFTPLHSAGSTPYLASGTMPPGTAPSVALVSLVCHGSIVDYFTGKALFVF